MVGVGCEGWPGLAWLALMQAVWLCRLSMVPYHLLVFQRVVWTDSSWHSHAAVTLSAMARHCCWSADRTAGVSWDCHGGPGLSLVCPTWELSCIPPAVSCWPNRRTSRCVPTLLQVLQKHPRFSSLFRGDLHPAAGAVLSRYCVLLSLRPCVVWVCRCKICGVLGCGSAACGHLVSAASRTLLVPP